MPQSKDKDSHTEHCCILHGCKYGKDRGITDEVCTVTSGQKPQSSRCEDCEEDGVDPTKPNGKITKDQLRDAHRKAIKELRGLDKRRSAVYSELHAAQKAYGPVGIRECLCYEDDNQHLSGCPMAISR